MVAIEVLLLWGIVTLFGYPPRVPILLATWTGVVFCLLIYFAISNWLSLKYPRRFEFGVRRQTMIRYIEAYLVWLLSGDSAGDRSGGRDRALAGGHLVCAGRPGCHEHGRVRGVSHGNRGHVPAGDRATRSHPQGTGALNSLPILQVQRQYALRMWGEAGLAIEESHKIWGRNTHLQPMPITIAAGSTL